MEKEKLVSLIMPLWNQLEHTRRALNSLKLYTNVPYELIIINNGSTDGTAEYVAKEFPDAQVITNTENLGWTKALNQGIKVAKGDFIGILNNDIILSRHWLKKILDHFKDDIGAVGPTSNFVSGRQKSVFNDGYMRERANYLIGFCLIFRREVINEIGGFDEQFFATSEEIDYAIRIRKTKWKMEIARDVFVFHEGFTSLNALPEVSGKPQALNEFHLKMAAKNIAKWGQEEIRKIYEVPPRVMIAVPHSGLIPAKHYLSMIAMEKPPLTHFVDVARAPVQIARNLSVQYAQKLNAEYVFFIDSDAIIPADTLLRLLKHDKDIVGVLAYTRHEPYFPCVFRRNKDNGHDDFTSIDGRRRGLLEVDGIGFHACLVHSRVFASLAKPWFEFSKFGEDLTFCEKAKQAGFKVWCDTDIITQHIGAETIIGEETFINYKANKDAKQERNKEVDHGREADPRRSNIAII